MEAVHPVSFTQLFRAIPGDRDIRLSLDVTHGFRHLSFLCYMGGLYLSSLRPNLTIQGAYYGMYREGQATQPFHDLRQLLELPAWFAAVTEFKRAGSTRGLESCLPSLFKKRNVPVNVQKGLRSVGEAYRAALPLELGQRVKRLEADNKVIQRALRSLPGGEELGKQVFGVFEDFSMEPAPEISGGWKGKITLSEFELRRQARLIQAHLDQVSFSTAFGLMREWVISWILWSEGQTNGEQWVQTGRDDVERRLGAFCELEGDLAAKVVDEQGILGLWKELRDIRNALLHHGMRKADYFQESPRAIDKITTWWIEIIDKTPLPVARLSMPPSVERILITGMGKTSGSLYSAIVHAQPEEVIVITSVDLIESAYRAAEAAGMSRDHLAVRAFNDPYGGVSEKDEVLGDLDDVLASAREVVLCLTGGSTLINFAAAELADRARELHLPVRTIGLVDRRDYSEQEGNPYQLGQILELKKKGKKQRK